MLLGGTVVMHCHAGIHRAAIAFCLTHMYLIRRPLIECIRDLMKIRYVEVYRAINEDYAYDVEREDHMRYIPGWEREALSAYNAFGLPQSAIEDPRPRVPPLDLLQAKAGLVNAEPEATLAACRTLRLPLPVQTLVAVLTHALLGETLSSSKR